MCSLEDIASHLIPGDSECEMPAGGEVDLQILTLDDLDKQQVSLSVELIAEYIHANSQTSCRELSSELFLELIMTSPPSIREKVSELGERLLGAYFSDTVVQQSLGIPSVPPFPRGTYIAQSSFENLEEVVNRGPIFRKFAKH